MVGENAFGSHLRKARERRNAREPGRYTIRQVAQRVGIQSGYLSRIERGLTSSLSEEKIKALAADLGESPDLLLGLIGKVSSDVQTIIQERPELFCKLIRDMKDLPDSTVEADSEYRKIERRLNQAQSVARIGSWERNFKTGEVFWSDEMYRLFGFDKASGPPAFKDHIPHVHPDDREVVHSMIANGDPGASEREYRFRIVTPDGRLRHAVARIAVERDQDGKPARVIGCTMDVTDKIEARKALATSEATLRSVIDSPERVAIFSLDRECRYIVFNNIHAEAMKRIWDVELEPGLHMPSVIKDAEFRAEAQKRFDRILAGEHFITVEEFPRYDRSRNVWEVYHSPIRDLSGEVIGLTVILTDITPHVMAERRLAESERLHRTLAENIPGCDMYLFDQDMRYLAASGSEMRRHGWNTAHWVGRTPEQALPAEMAPLIIPHYQAALEGNPSSCEFHYKDQHYLLQAVPVPDEGGDVRHGMALVQNITRRKLAEKALQASHDDLERKVAQRTGELEKAKKDLERELLDRWSAEQALAQKEALYRSLVETIPYGVQEFDLSGRRIYTNAAMNGILGYEPGELDGTFIWDTKPNEEQADAARRFMAYVASFQPDPETYYTQAMRKDGSQVDLRLDWAYKRGGDGEPVGVIAVVTDVTKQKEYEREILEQRELFNTFADQIPGLAFIKDAESRLVYANQAMRDFYGADELMGLRDDEYLPPHIAGRTLKNDAKALQNGPQVVEGSVPDKLGRRRIWRTAKFPITRQGKAPLLGCVSIEITKEAELWEALAASEAHYRNLAEQSPVSIISFDSDGVITFVNKWHLDVFCNGEVGRDAFLGVNILNLPGVAEAGIQGDIARLMRGESIELRDVMVPNCATGRDSWLSMRGVPIRKNSGFCCGILISEDVTQQLLAKQALTESETRYRMIAENITDIVWALDQDMTPLYYSPSIKSALGYEPEEAKALPKDAWFTPQGLDTCARHAEIMKACIQAGDFEGVARRFELSHIHKDGREVWMEVDLKAVTDKQGVFSHLLGVSRDITERKQAEERLRDSLAEKQLLLQEVHHRVKNNLQIISSLLDMTARRSANTEVRETLGEMQTKVQAMSLIHAMIYAGESLNRVNIASYLRRLYDELTSMHAKSFQTIEPDLDLEPVELPLDMAVPCALALNEIISNAFRHAFKNGGKGRLRIRLARGNGQVSISVADNGPGLPRDFDPETATTMGLKLVRDIVRLQLQGRLDFKSGQGTTVTLSFTNPTPTVD